MKRTFRIMAAVLCLSVMLFAFTACSKKEEASEETPDTAPIVGTWEYEYSSDMYYTFNEDGTGSYYFVSGEMKFTYEDDGEAVTLHYETATEPSVYKYTIEDDVLSIEDSLGEYVKYIKK